MPKAKVLIAGGGIGGVTAAIALIEAGHAVEVYEQAPQLGEIGAGIQISANAGRVLTRLGLGPAIEATAVRPSAYVFRIFDSGEILQEIPFDAAYLERNAIPYYTIHRADLMDALVARLAELDPAAVRLNKTATGFEDDGSRVTLRFADGTTASGDALIGADGIKSAIRARILGETPVEYSGDAAWRITVPSDRLRPETRSDRTEIWAGPGRHGVVYGLRKGELTNFVGLVEYGEWEDESWTTARPWEELRADYEGWHPKILDIIDNADRDKCYRWAVNRRTPTRGWSRGRATLLGDAAHPTVPYMAQGAAMAIEDGAVLTRCLDACDDVAEALAMYERNRFDRTARIVEESTANGKLFHLPSVAALREAFAKRDMNRERNAWLYSYDPWTVDLV